MSLIERVGLAAAIVLPFWNIPLIVKIQRRRSSKDMSLSWTLGVWVCLLLMLPSGLASSDTVFKTFTIINIMLFSGVVVQVLRFHFPRNGTRLDRITRLG